MCLGPCIIIGFALLATVESVAVRYFAVFLPRLAVSVLAPFYYHGEWKTYQVLLSRRLGLRIRSELAVWALSFQRGRIFLRTDRSTSRGLYESGLWNAALCDNYESDAVSEVGE
jgi:hypothetical protein